MSFLQDFENVSHWLHKTVEVQTFTKLQELSLQSVSIKNYDQKMTIFFTRLDSSKKIFTQLFENH